MSIYPYQAVLARGERQSLELRVRNYHQRPMKIEIALVAPAEWKIEPDVVHLEVPASARARGEVNVTVPAGWSAREPRFAIAADVMCDGRYLGQITEAVVELRS